MRPHKLKEESEKKLVAYAERDLITVKYDDGDTISKEVDSFVDNYHGRIRRDNRTLLSKNPYSEQGIGERGKKLQNKLSLVDKKLNESISKNMASFVVTSFVSDAFCKREHLANITYKEHQR